MGTTRAKYVVAEVLEEEDGGGDVFVSRMEL